MTDVLGPAAVLRAMGRARSRGDFEAARPRCSSSLLSPSIRASG